jgi:hypothetical protein
MCCQMRVGSCGHISTRQAINVTVSRDPNVDRAYLLLKALGWDDWMPGPVLGQGGRQNGQTSGEILHSLVYRNEEK